MDFITILILITLAVVFTFGCARENSGGIFNLDQSTVWKGLCCIVVIFVHFPPSRQNSVQMAVHSFGYIAVTLFFMLSGYGLRWSLEYKPNYLQGFFRNRIPSLIVPYIITNLLWECFAVISGQSTNIWAFLIGSIFLGVSFVQLLLLFYVAFYIIYSAPTIPAYHKDVLMCTLVIIYSAVGGLGIFNTWWDVESLGFAYGIAAFSMRNQLTARTSKGSLLNLIFAILFSLLLGILYLKFKSIDVLGKYFLRLFLGMAIIMVIFLISYKFRFGNFASRFLGKISYEVFLLHGLAMSLINTIIIHVHFRPISSGAYIAFAISAALILSTVVNLIDSNLVQFFKRLIFPKPKNHVLDWRNRLRRGP
jgi:peptidoglycan/LPS O-acetylase OafA/YrhL